MTVHLSHDFGALAGSIAQQAADARSFVVAIDGPGCCGKSTLVRSLCNAETEVLETDYFHAQRGYVADAGSPLPYRRWPEFVAAARALMNARAATFRPIDWATFELGSPMTVSPKRVLIIEGIGALHPDIAGDADLRIWVDGRAGTRMARTAVREGRDMSQEWAPYVELEQAYFKRFRPWDSADLFVIGAELSWANTRDGFARLIDAGVRAA